MREAGVLDGIWTAAASAGGKIQALVLLGAAGAVGGIEGTGLVVLVTSTALLISSIIDAGLTPQIGRLAARGEIAGRSAVVRPLAWRVAIHVPAQSAAFCLFVWWGAAPEDPVPWLLAQVIYGVAYHLASSMTGLAYGQFRFRATAVVNAVIRLSTVPMLVAAALAGWSGYALIVVLAVGELVIAGVQYAVARDSRELAQSPRVLWPRNTWRYGIGAVANTIMNRSDTVVLAWGLTATGLGVYAVASQTQNALTTVAMIPAGALLVHVARAGRSRQADSVFSTTATVTLALYGAIALPFMLFPSPLVEVLFRVTLDDVTPLRICLAAGVFSVIGGVQMQHLTGLGEAREITRIWLTTAVASVTLMVILAFAFGAVGAALGALGRDLLFFFLTRRGITRTARRAEPRQ
ncbi:hypothetical protein Dac01nite_05320 [Demequina activiva]|uniref:Membrane protein involved in the export of O-antigen and teichoic acid n=1 Tax=Demequina activiva TaxID=1582364 RepID=A0A919Q4N9_9MICO|nr:hypothetical protein Dac01nite_05320 [Demequina activiva]